MNDIISCSVEVRDKKAWIWTEDENLRENCDIHEEDVSTWSDQDLIKLAKDLHELDDDLIVNVERFDDDQ